MRDIKEISSEETLRILKESPEFPSDKDLQVMLDWYHGKGVMAAKQYRHDVGLNKAVFKATKEFEERWRSEET